MLQVAGRPGRNSQPYRPNLDATGEPVMRLSQLKEVLFPVEEYPVFVDVGDESGERRLAARDKKAIVDISSHRVLGVVSRGYRLVTNQQALEWAHECCQNAFPNTNQAEWDVSATDGPSTGGYCRIDLCTERRPWTWCYREGGRKHSGRSFASRTATTGRGRSHSISASIERSAAMV